MGSGFLSLLAPALCLFAPLDPSARVTPPDSLPTFATPDTRALVERAQARHRAGDSAVVDYKAKLRYRFSLALGRRAWARIPVAAVEEQEASIHWQRPNDVRIDVLGRRFRSRREELTIVSGFDEPWIVPRALGDSLRVFGTDFPGRAALHPLAEGGPELYRYAIVDSVTIATQQGGRITLIGVEVVPKRTLPAAVAGRLWIDAASGEVVRFTAKFLGTDLWVLPEEDTSEKDARRANRIINRILSLDADLEYALQEGRYWMPYRQVISGTVRIPIVSDVVVPFQVITTFNDYEINTGTSVVFDLPFPDSTKQKELRRERRDSLREERRGDTHRRGEEIKALEYAGYWKGGRYQVRRPPGDSLRAYNAWGDSLELDLSPADEKQFREAQAEVERLAEGLDGRMTGRPRLAFEFERLADIFRYNRVSGASLGASYRWRVPAMPFTSVYPNLRYGFSDGRILGGVSAVRDAPGGRVSIAGYRDLKDQDPISPGIAFGNSLRALLLARDDADYYLAEGASVGYETSLGVGVELALRGGYEWQWSTPAEAASGVNDLFGGDGRFPGNPAIQSGGHGFASARLDWSRVRHRLTVSIDGLASQGGTTGRLWARWRADFFGRAGLTARIKAGIATDDAVPQMQFRAGGVNTVRGFEYARQRGQAFWAVQLDYGLSRKLFRPVVFADAGQAARPGDFGHTPLLAGVGAGASLLRGLVRLDLAVPVTPGGGARVDLVFGMPR